MDFDLRSKAPSRRLILKAALAGGAVAAAGGAWLATRPGEELAPPPGSDLTPRQVGLLSALAHAFLPPHPGMPDPDALDCTRAIADILRSLDESARAEVIQLLGLMENALPNFLFGGRPRPFTRMGGDEQRAVLAEWGASALSERRAGYLVAHALVMAAYFGNRASWASTGYPGPPEGIYEPQAPRWMGEGPRPHSRGTWAADAGTGDGDGDVPRSAGSPPADARGTGADEGGTP